mmetsp:Transcript_18887/g.44381  ORF Transcript_18887/g.44381 Transcript_18887/m.44381 type:complete len:258 (+) Transcript_18887:184-957(+)
MVVGLARDPGDGPACAERVEADGAFRGVAAWATTFSEEPWIVGELGQLINEVVGGAISAARHPDELTANKEHREGYEEHRDKEDDECQGHIVFGENEHGHLQFPAAVLRTRQHPVPRYRPHDRSQNRCPAKENHSAGGDGSIARRAVTQNIPDDCLLEGDYNKYHGQQTQHEHQRLIALVAAMLLAHSICPDRDVQHDKHQSPDNAKPQRPTSLSNDLHCSTKACLAAQWARIKQSALFHQFSSCCLVSPAMQHLDF